MRTREIVNFWTKESNEDFAAAKSLFNSGYYSRSLFFAHLSLEKLLKAIFVKNQETHSPFSHDLLFLSQKSKIVLDQKQKQELDEISTFNVRARYDNIKRQFHKRANKVYTVKWLKIINFYRLWLKNNYLKLYKKK